MAEYASFYTHLFNQLEISPLYVGYRLQSPLVGGSRAHSQRIHKVGPDWINVSFIKKPQEDIKPEWTRNAHGHPLRLEWILQKGGKAAYDKMHEHRADIESRIGHELEWDSRADRVRSIISLYYWGADDDARRIEWVVDYAKLFVETLSYYDKL